MSLPKLDPPQTSAERDAIDRIKRAARDLSDRETDGMLSDVIMDLGDAIVIEIRRAVTEQAKKTQDNVTPSKGGVVLARWMGGER